MIYILHGDDTTASRRFLESLIIGKTTVFLDGRKIAFKELEENLFSSGLFGDEKIIVLENFLSKNKKKKEILEKINSNTADLVFWDDTKLPATSTKMLKEADIKSFLLPQYYFQFLDSFSPNNSKRVYALYQNVLETMEPELVLYSLIKRLRQLIILSQGNTESLKMQDWQISKLKSQLLKWEKKKLVDFFLKLEQTEVDLKSGGLPAGLLKHLDILILTQLR